MAEKLHTTHTGMRSTADWPLDSQRPLDWDAAIKELFINADTPLTAITKMFKTEKATDPEFRWYREDFPAQAGVISEAGAIYSTSEMSTKVSVSTGLSAGSTYFVKMAAFDVGYFRPRLIVMLRERTNPNNVCYGRVLNQVKNGANSYIIINMIDSSTQAKTALLDRYTIIADSNPEGGPPPRGISYDPVEYKNYTQIVKTAIELTRTAERTSLRHEDELVRQRSKSLREHAVKREKSFLYGIPSQTVGDNGKPERTTGGLLWFLRTYAPQNVINIPNSTESLTEGHSWYDLLTEYPEWQPLSNVSWEVGSYDFLNLVLERVFNYGSSDSRIALCGSGTIQALQRSAKFNASINITTGETEFGMKVNTWLSPFGEIHFKTHPLFKYDLTERYSALILDPGTFTRKVIDETFTKKKDYKDGGVDSHDGRFEEFVTEDGLKIELPESCAYVTGFGKEFPTYPTD